MTTKHITSVFVIALFVFTMFFFFDGFSPADYTERSVVSGAIVPQLKKSDFAAANEFAESIMSKPAKDLPIKSAFDKTGDGGKSPSILERVVSAPSAIKSAVSFKLDFFKPSPEISVPISGDVRVEILDDKTVCVVGNYDEFLRSRFSAECGDFLRGIDSPAADLPEWSKRLFYNILGAEIILKYRPKIADAYRDFKKFSFSGGIEAAEGGYWLSPLGQFDALKSDGTELLPTRNASVAHYAFFKLKKPLKNGGSYSVTTPNGETVAFKFSDVTNLSGAIKANQVGYSMSAGRKYAYVGAWLGELGAADMSRIEGRNFFILDERDGKKVFAGKIERRGAESFYNGAPFTGENVYQLDFSSFKGAGKYHIYIENVGRSHTFEISPSSIGDAFYVHMKGLYHQRCGIAKKSPHTDWHLGRCHMRSYQSDFPPNNKHYAADFGGEDCGFFNSRGKRVSVSHFKLIELRKTDILLLDVNGGWHDAADYDRRSYHYDVVNDLLSAYLFRPKNFSDGQLNMPESSNGIPDIVDEALWGMEIWRKAQKINGAVPGWIEATSHPKDDNPATDPQRYYVSAATRESTMQYAAHASMMSLALKNAGNSTLSKIYFDSAALAYEWASNPKNRFTAKYEYPLSRKDGGDGKTLETVTYREEPECPVHLAFKAAFNLWLLSKKTPYIDDVVKFGHSVVPKFGETLWKINPFFFSEFLKYGKNVAQLESVYGKFKGRMLGEADARLDMLDNNYPYRTPWYAPSHPYVTHMSWGTYHPLARAKFFVNAYELTGDVKYRDAAFLCNDWHNGANPSGQTMTSGLGKNYPAKFLDLPSYTFGGREFLLGITPYRNTFGIARDCITMAYGLIYKPRPDRHFNPEPTMIMPKSVIGDSVLSGAELSEKISKRWPIWRRYANVEAFSVAASEFTVSETISPAASVTGWLLDGGYFPSPEVRQRKQADNLYKLRGYAPLP